MKNDITRFMWVTASDKNCSTGQRSVSSFNADREVHAPGEYVSLEQWLRMIRPGRQLL